MSFAIIETGGKQYKVSPSNILKVERLDVEKGQKIEFKKVLLLNDTFYHTYYIILLSSTPILSTTPTTNAFPIKNALLVSEASLV